MKTAASLLLLVATCSALPFQLNQLLPDFPEKTNTLDGSGSAAGTNEATDQSAFDASSSVNQPLPAAIAPNEPQQPAFVGVDRTASFGALVTDQKSSADRSTVDKKQKNPQPLRESVAKQFSNDQQPPFRSAFGTEGSVSPVPSFGASAGGQLGGGQQQTAFGAPSSSQFGGSQQSGFNVPSDDQFKKNQQPAFGAFSSSQQSGFGASSDSQFNNNQQPASGASSSSHQSGFGAPSDSQFSSNQQPAFGASSTSQFGDNQQSALGVGQFGDSQQPSGFGSSSRLQSGDGGQQVDVGVSGNSQFGGPAPEAQFGGNQQPDFASNIAGGQNNAAVGLSGPFNVALDDEYYIRTAFPSAGFRPTKYTSLDVSQVDFQNALRNSGHEEYISVSGDDASDEAEVYRLVGVAPASAVRGGAATTYSANIGLTVPVYRELDDVFEERLMMEAFGVRNPQASVYSAMADSQRPRRVKAEATLSGGNFAVLLDD